MGKGGEDKTVNIGPIGLPEGQNDALPGDFSHNINTRSGHNYLTKPVWTVWPIQRAGRKNTHHLVYNLNQKRSRSFQKNIITIQTSIEGRNVYVLHMWKVR